MRLPTTSLERPNVPTSNISATYTSKPLAISRLIFGGVEVNVGRRGAAGQAQSNSGNFVGFVTAAQASTPSSSLVGGWTSPQVQREPLGPTTQVHNQSNWANTSSYTPVVMADTAHTVPTTSTTTSRMGANDSMTTWGIEPPRHTRPLYSHIPLPDEHVDIHPSLSYDVGTEWHTPNAPLGPDNRYWSAPATNPPRGSLTIILPSTRQRMSVYPSSSQTNSYREIVTVWDVFIAVEMVMNRLDNIDDVCIRSFPPNDRRTAEGRRRCICKGEIPSLEYLRQRYGRAGLVKVRGDDGVWMLHIGHQ